MSARRGDFHGAFDMLLTFDLAEIKVLFCGSNVGPAVERGHRLQSDISAQKMDDLRKGTRSVDVDTFHTAASAAFSSGTIRVCRHRRFASKATTSV
jgi:hypothetical protein